MKITIIYDNTSIGELEADWGFSCLVEFDKRKILFDTGADGSILLSNMEKLGIDPTEISEIFISHGHWDHVGGLLDFLKINDKVRIYVPQSFSDFFGTGKTLGIKKVVITKPKEIHKNIFSTGELEGIEQSLVIKTKRGLVIVVGCSHPGIEKILKAASQFGKPYALIGGFHGFDKYEILKDLEVICPTHCTQHTLQIKELYPDKFVQGGAGKIIRLD